MPKDREVKKIMNDWFMFDADHRVWTNIQKAVDKINSSTSPNKSLTDSAQKEPTPKSCPYCECRHDLICRHCGRKTRGVISGN